MSWVKAASSTDIAAGECKGVCLDGIDIAIYNVGGSLHATSNICTHRHTLLSEGYLEGEYIECPLHQGRFNVVTGEPEGPPVSVPLRVFPIRVENAVVFIDI